MKILIISNNISRPSYRQRIESYLPRLQAEGFDCAVEQSPADYIRRWRLFVGARRYDAVILHKKALNFWEAHMLRKHAAKIIYDFDDAVMYSPKKPWNNHTSHMRLFKRTASMADLIIAGNSFLAEHARRFCPNVYVVPTGLDIKPYMTSSTKKDDRKTRLVWIGSASTLKYLEDICPVLQTTAQMNVDMVLRVIADVFPSPADMKLEKHPWSLETQNTDLLACDIGLAPLPDNRFTRGKCGFKILQYFAAGLPVIASPVGVNSELIEQSGAGLLASTPGQWQEAIVKLTQNVDLRAQMSQKARHYVKRYDSAVLAEEFCGIIKTQIGK